MAWNNIIGKQFGDLIVIDQDYVYPNGKRHIKRWECKCSCGNTVVVQQPNLTSGTITCCYTCTRQKAIDDLTGQKFGKLTVMWRGPDYECKSGKEAQWWCDCDGHNIILVRGIYLRNGHTTSCGCARNDNQNLTNDERHIRYMNKQAALIPYGVQLQPNSVPGVSFLTDEEIVEYNNLNKKEN